MRTDMRWVVTEEGRRILAELCAWLDRYSWILLRVDSHPRIVYVDRRHGMSTTRPFLFPSKPPYVFGSRLIAAFFRT